MRYLIIALFLSACTTPVPPAAPTPRIAAPVAASFAKTWDAVVDVFAAKNIPIKNMDRSSGFITTEEMTVGSARGGPANALADCGTTTVGNYWQPSHANYNIRVKGDEKASTVQVSVFWKAVITRDIPTINCTSKGVWENEAEGEIKAKAEGR